MTGQSGLILLSCDIFSIQLKLQVTFFSTHTHTHLKYPSWRPNLFSCRCSVNHDLMIAPCSRWVHSPPRVSGSGPNRVTMLTINLWNFFSLHLKYVKRVSFDLDWVPFSVRDQIVASWSWHWWMLTLYLKACFILYASSMSLVRIPVCSEKSCLWGKSIRVQEVKAFVYIYANIWYLFGATSAYFTMFFSCILTVCDGKWSH